MKDKISFVVKVVIASWLLSLGIKYSDRILVLNATNTNAVLIVFTPCLLMAVFLIWKYFTDSNSNEIEAQDKP